MTIGSVPFEDDRVTFPQWKELKPSTPYGSLPVMKIDGAEAAQSNALLRYCGKLAGLYTECPLEALKVDEIIDVMGDFSSAVYRYRGDDKEKLRAEREKFCKEDAPRYFGGMEKRLEKFGSGPWAVGDKITIADLAICHAVTNIKCGILDYVPKDLLDCYTRGMKSYNSVMEHPKVAEWYKKHPVKTVS